jgi:hypothetical protein
MRRLVKRKHQKTNLILMRRLVKRKHQKTRMMTLMRRLVKGKHRKTRMMTLMRRLVKRKHQKTKIVPMKTMTKSMANLSPSAKRSQLWLKRVTVIARGVRRNA